MIFPFTSLSERVHGFELIFILTGVMLFAYWLNYVMGGPLSDDPRKIDEKAILFKFPFWLATRRLILKNLYWSLREGARGELKLTNDVRVRNQLRLEKRKDMYLTGRDFFTWERSLLCPICLHWWLTLVVAFPLLWMDMFHARDDFFLAAFIYLANHLIIRKIS